MFLIGPRAIWISIVLGGILVAVGEASAAQSIARQWDEQILSAIRIDTPHPPVHARNLFSLSVCMYDAWAAYDSVAIGYVYHGKFSAGDVEAARQEAISYAAYRMLRERFVFSKSASNTLAALDAKLASLGYNTNNFSTDTSTPAGVGNSVYLAVSAWFINDGAREANGTPSAPYPDYPVGQGGYVSVNSPMATGVAGVGNLADVNHWQPLAITNAVDQNGFPQGPVQKFLGAQWLTVLPFALNHTQSTVPEIDPGPPPHLNGVGDIAFRTNVVEVIRRSSELTPDDGVTVDISPGAFGNNTLGANDGNGHPVNPFTGSPYASNVVKRGDFVRVLAEFWADGPSSETPPGHWNVIANNVADNPLTVKKIGGSGSIVSDLEWDVKVYFAVNASVHDGACAAWGLKRYYDGWRPITAIRYMGGRGQSSDPNAPAYDPNGLPLITNLIELVTEDSALPGGRHEGLPVGSVAIHTWPGQPTHPLTEHSGVRWITPDTWLPYQKANFVTPSFPGYISGHSTFSRSAAEVLAAITGTNFFPGGLASFTITNLAFENGPTQPITLQWGTYFDAADQAGLSRIWGGIHPPVDDFAGRRAGSQCGLGVWALAKKYFDGSILASNSFPSLQPIADQTIDEQTQLSLTATATDTDTPQQTLTFNLDPGNPPGVTLSAGGLLQWTPTEQQGPGVYKLTVRVTDSGAPKLSALRSFNVTVNEVNTAPFFIGPFDKTVTAGSSLSFVAASDFDFPAQFLTCTLDPGSPAGINLQSGTGLFSWVPSDAQSPSTYSVGVHVTDDGNPPLGASATYIIHVLERKIQVNLSRITNSVVLNWKTTTNKVYQVQAKQSLNQANWTTLASLPSTGMTNLTYVDGMSASSNRFYRVFRP